MANAAQTGVSRTGLRGRLRGLRWQRTRRGWNELLIPGFKGSRSELEGAIALRLQAAVVLVFLAARSVHLAQAGVDLALGWRAYTRPVLGLGLAIACLLESTAFAVVTVRARRLTRRALLADAAFATVGVVVMSVVTSTTPGRLSSLDWMLPYSVGTATGVGLVAFGGMAGERAPAVDGTPPPSAGRAVRLLNKVWPPLVVIVLASAYIASSYAHRRLASEDSAQIWGNAANYLVFFVAAVVTAWVVRRRMAVMSARNAEVTRAAAELAREAQWRAVAVDVFGPVTDLLDRVAVLDDGPVPASLRVEAERLMSMIDAVRPGSGDWGRAVG